MSSSSDGFGELFGAAVGLGFGLIGLKILSDFGRSLNHQDKISHILSLSQPTFSGSNERKLLVRIQNSNKARKILEHYGYKINNAIEVERGIILLIFEYR